MEKIPNKDTDIICISDNNGISPKEMQRLGVVSCRERMRTRLTMDKEKERRTCATTGQRPDAERKVRAACEKKAAQQAKTAQKRRLKQIDEMRANSETTITGKALRVKNKGYMEQVAEMKKAAGIK